jgi:hypothetical protein
VDVPEFVARHRPRPGALPGKVKVTIGDLIRSEISSKELSNA